MAHLDGWDTARVTPAADSNGTVPIVQSKVRSTHIVVIVCLWISAVSFHTVYISTVLLYGKPVLSRVMYDYLIECLYWS